jgi:hypothetical protein
MMGGTYYHDRGHGDHSHVTVYKGRAHPCHTPSTYVYAYVVSVMQRYGACLQVQKRVFTMSGTMIMTVATAIATVVVRHYRAAPTRATHPRRMYMHMLSQLCKDMGHACRFKSASS